ncbi:MAG TPA: hypothetical protein VFM34_03890 [Moraxellaceae bacterium]|nr:hypothetical protein [Moraxellaceae bacterium]
MPTSIRPLVQVSPVLLSHSFPLPERLGPWRRARDAAELATWGISTAPFLQALADAAEAPGALYFHPACRHFHAWVPESIEASEAVQFRRVGAPGAPALRLPFSLLDLQRMQELRDSLRDVTEDELDDDRDAFTVWAQAAAPAVSRQGPRPVRQR